MVNFKTCSKCKCEKHIDEFHKGNGALQRRSQCKVCSLEYETPERKARREEARKINMASETYRAHRNEVERKRKARNIEKTLWEAAKNRAKRNHIEFNIDIEDIKLVDKCPLLNINLQKAEKNAKDNSYSLDRIDNSKGYIKGNIWIISKKANALKGNASLEELTLLVHNLKKKLDTLISYEIL